MEMTSVFHYILTMLFFTVLLLSTLVLTASVFNMDVSPTDTNAVNAQNLIKDAVIVGWGAIVIILLGLVGVAIIGYRGGFEYEVVKHGLQYMSGEAKIFASLRIISFSILVGASFIIALLLSAAAEEILNSDDPSQYTNQYDYCLQFAHIMYLHITILTCAQVAVYCFSIIKGTMVYN